MMETRAEKAKVLLGEQKRNKTYKKHTQCMATSRSAISFRKSAGKILTLPRHSNFLDFFGGKKEPGGY